MSRQSPNEVPKPSMQRSVKSLISLRGRVGIFVCPKPSLLAHGRYGGGPAAKQVDRKAATNPNSSRRRPTRRRVGRLDEVAAGRKPILRWKPRAAAD